MLRNTAIARSQLKWPGESKHGFNGSPAKTAAEPIEDLSNASQKGHLYESQATYTRPHVLVIDEVGYLTYGPDAANLLFHGVNDRPLRKRPMIVTSNKPLNQWGKVLRSELTWGDV